MTTLSAYLTISRNLAKYQDAAAKSAEAATRTKYFSDNVGKAKSAADLVNNPRLFSYAMTAFGLGDRLYAKALMTQVLQQGVGDAKALANKLNDPNIRAFAQAFDFKGQGASVTASEALVKNVVGLYAENALETDQAKQNPGVDLALYFQRKASAITNAYSVLADRKILKVVQTALDISPMTGLMPIDQQASLLEKKINFADFQDPTKLQKFIARFAAQYDAKNGGVSTGAADSTTAALFGGAVDAGFSSSLWQALQTYRA